MIKINPTSRSVLVAGVTLLGSAFAIANAGATTGFLALDWLTIAGLGAWTSGNILNLLHKYQTRKKSINLPENPPADSSQIKSSSYQTVNAALQMTAATSFIVRDLTHQPNSALLVRVSGSFFWLSNAFLSGLTAQKLKAFFKTEAGCALAGEICNQTGATLYIIYACILWEEGDFLPLKIGANLCWFVAAANDLVMAYDASRDENKEAAPVVALDNPDIELRACP